MKNFFIVDAETDGLYGCILSVAAIVCDAAWQEAALFYGIVDIKAAELRNRWTIEHVYPILRDNQPQVFASEAALLQAFWDFWLKHRETVLCLADVPVPVEAGLFRKCVTVDTATRCMLAPFPLLDLASMLYAQGYEPLADRRQLAGLPDVLQHNALNDVRLTAVVLRRCIYGQ